MKLSPTQESIVSTKGNLIVRASAGTGKTHTMVTKIINEIEENKDHKVIAAITFTIKAAQEIKDRISIDVSRHFVGTNNSFAIEEIIKPFMKDVYGTEFNVDMNTDYSVKVSTFSQGVEKIRSESTLCSYINNTKNFIFELAFRIIKQSKACQLYIRSKYFKIYIDEYQDCDKDMHTFFMFLCNKLGIETFIVGDEKQSIYIWRGAYPEAFKSIWEMENFNKIFMGDNFRSCQQIQNYSNLLCEETRDKYIPVVELESIIWLNSSNAAWAVDTLPHLDLSKKIALLRFSNNNANMGAEQLSQNGIDCVYIPKIPISEITTEVAWLYTAIAKFIILERYSVYDLISEIPVEGEDNKRKVSTVNKYLNDIKSNIGEYETFTSSIITLAEYLNYSINHDAHLEKLFQTINDTSLHVAFEPEKYNHISITFHSSKGLEFDQVIIFAEDYRLDDMASIYNHYVAVTRAKSKLIIVKVDNWNANLFERNLSKVFELSNLSIEELVEIY